MQRGTHTGRQYTAVGAFIVLLLQAAACPAGSDQNSRWRTQLQEQYFQDRPLIESDEIIELEAPDRAEDAAIVPLRIKAKIPQTDARYIKTITLIIDKNPAPLAGRFHFTPMSGRADLALRVRVNEYTSIRAIAETSDGKLYMSRRFVKASGGCSAPIGTNLDAAMQRLGKIKVRVHDEQMLGTPLLTQLGVSHPNITGMQMDQLSRLYSPAHFVQSIKITFAGELVLSAETDISVSENPNLRFYFVPHKPGELRAEVLDNRGMRFNHSYTVAPDQPSPPIASK